MKPLLRFLRIHGETLFFVAFLAIVACVIGPSLDRYDAERAAVAHR
jgi:hypothetical protein